MDRKIDGKTGMSKLLILSGEIGSGKTTLLLNFLDQLKEYGLQIHGILTPPVIVNGEKTGIDLVDLKTGERKRSRISLKAVAI